MNNVHFENRKLSRQFFIFVWVMYAIVYMTKSCFGAAMASIVFEGIMTKSQTGLIISAFNLVYAPLQIFGGVFADKYDPEKLIKIGLVGGGIANLIIYLNQNYYLVLTVWILNAVVQFALWPAVFKIVSSQIVKEDRKNATYYISFGTTAGLFLAYLVAAFLPSWEYNFAVSAAALLLLALVWHIVTKRVEIYMIPDKKTDESVSKNAEFSEKISTFKLFLISGFLILIAVAFIRTLVVNSIQTLASTMLMESYKKVSPLIGNLLNILIISSGIIGTVVVKEWLYPKRIKSAPTAIVTMLIFSSVCAVALLYLGKVNIYLVVASMCLISGALTSIHLLLSYCNLRYAKFGKSGTAAGIINAASSFGIVFSGYGITIIAEKFDWSAVTILFFVLTAVSIVLSAMVIPLWKSFKKKYHPHALQPIVKN